MTKLPKNPPQLHRHRAGQFFKINCKRVRCTYLVDSSRCCGICDVCVKVYGCPCGNRPKKSVYWNIYRTYMNAKFKLKNWL